jgi:hypothetical protein
MTSRNIIFMVLACLVLTSASAQEKYTLVYKYEKGKSYRYEQTNNTSFIQEIMGQENKGSTSIRQRGTLTIDEVLPDGIMQGTFTWEDFNARTKVMQTDTVINLDSYKSKQANISLSSNGKMTITRADSVAAMPGMATAPVNTMLEFIVLPEKGYAVGDTFSIKTTDTTYDAKNNETIIEVVRKYTYERRTVMSKDILCYSFSYEGTISSSGKMETMGMEMYQETEGTEKGNFLITEGGILYALQSTTQKDMTLVLTGETAMTIPMTLNESKNYKLIE